MKELHEILVAPHITEESTKNMVDARKDVHKYVFKVAMKATKDEIKAAMGEKEALQAGEYKISWKNVTSSRLDTAALKQALPEIAARFTKESTTRRFTIA